MATSKARKAATRRYDEKNTRQIMLKLNLKTDADILEKLDSVKNRQGYIKALIRADMMSCCDEIVRCRDCNHYVFVDEYFNGEDDIPIYGCDLFEFKEDRPYEAEPQNPNGYCAWAERSPDMEKSKS